MGALLILACNGEADPTPDVGPPADGPMVDDIQPFDGARDMLASDSDLNLPDLLVPDLLVPDLPPWTCPGYKPAANAGNVTSPKINETSGLVVSAANPGVLWLHNDSGDTPRAFAISDAGKLLGDYTLGGANAADWEDMAAGPGPTAGQTYLYFGDIGDNPSKRASIAVYRVKEPTVSVSQPPATSTLSGVEKMTFVYPDGAHNAETLLVDPLNGDLFIVVKTGGATAGIYRSPAPQGPGTTRTLVKVGDVSLGVLITGGDISADGTEILLRTYGGAYLWHRGSGASVAQALAAKHCSVPAAAEPQGEAIAFAPQTKHYYTLSEGTNRPLNFYERK